MTLDARVKKSTESILRAGLELLNQNKDAKLTDVATKAGVGRATLYRLFKNKDDLVMAITIYCLEEYERATSTIEKEAWSALHAMELLFRYTMPLTLEFQFLSNLEELKAANAEIARIEKEHKAEMLELIEAIRAEKKIANQLPSSWLVNLVDGLFYAGWLQQTNDDYTAEQAAKLAFDVFKKAIN